MTAAAFLLAVPQPEPTIIGLPPWAAAVVAIAGAFGLAGVSRLIAREWVKRRVELAQRSDRASDQRVADTRAAAESTAQANQTMFETLTAQVDARLSDYRSQIDSMRKEHAEQITELKAENKVLGRRVEDMGRTLRDYQMGLQVPRGMVLVPLSDIRQMRSEHPGVLPRPWYVGEDDMPPPSGSIDARITPLPTSTG